MNTTVITYTLIDNPNLMDDTAYIFTVTANNINGSSISSEPSNPIIPVTIPNTITGNRNLINGVPYTFNVTANYINGTSARSEDSNSVITSIIPDPPTTITSISENSEVIVSWIAPTSNGGSVITKYTVISNPVDELVTIPPNVTTNGTTTTKTVTGLINGKAYTFNVFATNINGDSLLSITSSEIIPSTVPDKPINVYAVPGNKEATIYWEPPLFNGGSDINSYVVVSSSDDVNPNGITKTVTAGTSTTTKGLKSSIPYTFTVKANNIKGFSIMSDPSLPIIPMTIPDAPTTITCTAGNKYIDLSWNIPNNGGTDILYYRIQYSSNYNHDWVDISSNTNHTSIRRLVNGTRYIFRIAAINLYGSGSYSLNTSEHVPFSIVESPYITNSKIGNNCASVFFTQANTGGYPITKYKYTLDNGISFFEKEVNISPIFISNINNGIQYNVKISAYTQAGWSILSNEISLTPNDNRSNEIKIATSNLTINTITDLKNQLFTDIISENIDNKIQIINNLALDISNQNSDLQISTLLSISLNIDTNSNSIKANVNNLIIDAGINKNLSYIISNPVIVNQVIDNIPFKSPDWVPTSLAVIVPNDNLLTIDLNQTDLILLLVPNIEYKVNATYSETISNNSYRIVYNRNATSRTLTINGGSNKKTTGDTILFNFPTVHLNFKINMLAGLGGQKILVPGGAGDPHILTVYGNNYELPHDEKCYLLYDNNIENDRVIITAKCWFLPRNIKDNSKFKNIFMDTTTYFRYINFYYNSENLTFDMETLLPVKYTTMKDLINNKLQYIKNDSLIKMSDIFDDKYIFKNKYNKIKIFKYKIIFDGKSRIIELENGNKFKLSFDLNCVDHRNEIKILEANFNNSTGALIKEDLKNCIEYFIPLQNNYTSKCEKVLNL